MTKLETLTATAMRDATADRPLAVLNLNRVGAPLYVVREIPPDRIEAAYADNSGTIAAGPFPERD